MYKVFIDHKPVIFGEKQELSGEFPVIEAKDVNSVKKDIRPFLAETSLDIPLQVACEELENDFQRIFRKHKWIQAAGGLVRRKDRFLLIKRNGLWDIPKGKIAKDEEIEIAAIREVMEECGINGHEIVRPLVVTYHTMKLKGKPAIKRTYWFEMKYAGRKDTFPQLNEGITKAKWMSEEHLFGIRGRTYGSINEVLDAYKNSIREEVK